MKILVAIKRVIDPYVKIRIKPDHTGVETQNVKMSINPFDEIALEEAIRLREQNIASEVIAVTIGNDLAQETLRHALALGADRAILIKSEKAYCSLNIAKILQTIVNQEQPELVLMGKQTIDGDNNQTPQMLAALLNWSQATYASKILIEGKSLTVTREIDGGLETLTMNLPAVVSTDLRLNEPRYASLPNIMKAKRKPLDILEVDSLQLDLKDHIQILSVKPPSARTAGVILDSVKTLVEKLNEAKAL
ncbi:electron transfer flavoprotein subunit beta [Legionella beliardensis]|uniref:Electron transfer flavoprotein subunit beta n=1 Tax=Legionella beliardensis TaxID=91822 RepID=A0A378I0Q3_9GAMM|nr:electron transfer flavoprotein subunit beta/FixA family protein [Legionella beliardensis]STX28245.1 electron transfer flavoprotein subunit beta [Legionella beliardensis]